MTVEPHRGVEWGVEVGIKNHLARNEHQINISWCHKQLCYVGRGGQDKGEGKLL